MAKECFCGCGRKVPFGRKRIANTLGHRLSDDIAHFQGAVDRTPDPEHDADLRRLVATGIPLRDKLAALVHRSEEHTSELQSRQYTVCRLLLEKKNIYTTSHP